MSDMYGFPWRTDSQGGVSSNLAGRKYTYFTCERFANDDTGTDDPLYSWTYPSNSFNYRGDTLKIRFYGITAANTNSKTVKFNFGSTALLTLTTTTSAAKWFMDITLIYAGPSGGSATGETNAYFKYYTNGVIGTTNVVNNGTTTDNPSLAISCSVTGNASSVSDITATGADSVVTIAASESDLVV